MKRLCSGFPGMINREIDWNARLASSSLHDLPFCGGGANPT